MTHNQIEYQKHLETARSNRTKEAETYRSNRAQEVETNRSNLAREGEMTRHNLASEHNDLLQLAESHRSNVARETETHRSNVEKEKETIRNNNLNYQVNSRRNEITREGNYLKEAGLLGPLALGYINEDDFDRASDSFSSAWDKFKSWFSGDDSDGGGGSTYSPRDYSYPTTAVTGTTSKPSDGLPYLLDVLNPGRLITDVIPQLDQSLASLGGNIVSTFTTKEGWDKFMSKIIVK